MTGEWQRGYDKGFADAKKQFDRPHGEWIEANSTDLKCSICGHRELKERTIVTFLNYCSLCGASMTGGDEE